MQKRRSGFSVLTFESEENAWQRPADLNDAREEVSEKERGRGRGGGGDCSREMVLDGRKHVHQKTSRWKMK